MSCITETQRASRIVLTMATLELLTSLAARSVSEIASLSIARKMSSRPSPGALMDYDEAPPWKPPAKPKRAGVRTPLAAKRRNMRKAELRAVRQHSPRAKAISWDAFVGLINVKVGDRDVFDPGAVSAQELGTVLALTTGKKNGDRGQGHRSRALQKPLPGGTVSPTDFGLQRSPRATRLPRN